MKTLLKVALTLLLATSALAQGVDTEVVQNSAGTRVLRTRDKQWLWGFGASTPTTFLSENIPIGAAFFNTSTGVVYYHSGSAWVSSASSVTPGTSVVGSSTNCFLYADASSVLQCSSSYLRADDSGAGNGLFGFRKTSTAGSGATNNFWGVSGTLTNTAAITWGSLRVYTATAGTSPTQLGAERIQLAAGYTGTALSFGVYALNSTASTGTAFLSDASATGVIGQSAATTAGTVVGVRGTGQNGDISLGVVGWANTTKNSGKNIGVYGSAANAGTTPIVVAGYFRTASTEPTIDTSAAIVGDNSSSAFPIAFFRDNAAAAPTTGATATYTIGDGAFAQSGNNVLTSATMTAENQARMSGSAIHSYTWSNAQVVALGANLVGDITVATLPAKTQIRNAYVVITGAAAGPATVTVSCGDAIGGTPFINYVVASDAKAAANTVYGDAVAERGTSIDVEFYYLPSYTATTLVTCHFISTVANLDQVTGSTGRVVLETSLLP